MYAYSKKQYLDIVKDRFDHKEIFKLVFGEFPVLNTYYLSPFREDKFASCYFEYGKRGDLLFVDWADTPINRDCIQAVMDAFGMSMDDSLTYITDVLGNGVIPLKKVKSIETKVHLPHKILVKKRNWLTKDAIYWKRYHITKKQLEDDNVFAISQFTFYSSKFKNFNTRYCSDIAYCYSEFLNGIYKIYRPTTLHKFKWHTNCTNNHIGNIRNIPHTDDYLIITKSYKDCRVIRNQGYNNTCWFQSENQFPELPILLDLAQRYKHIFIFFDNDISGKNNSELLQIKYKAKGINVHRFQSPFYNAKDASDIIVKYGTDVLQTLLYNNVNKKLI